MTVRQLIKPFVPRFALEIRVKMVRDKLVSEHKKMNLTQIERWLSQKYKENIGADLNLSNPQRYTEKIQWCKLHAMDEMKSMLADKYAAREWVASKIGDEYLIPLLGVWDSPDEIDFDALPNSFVLKTNNASGTNLIVPEKKKLNKRAAVRCLNDWLSWEFGWNTFEPQYLNIEPKIIAEKYMVNADGSEIRDYKFICFEGRVRYVWVDVDRHSMHTRVTMDPEWKVQPWVEGTLQRPSSLPPKPDNLCDLIRLVECLAEPFPCVRVDFYVIDGRFYFGEMTFSSNSGFLKIIPDSYDFELGALWDITKEHRCDFSPSCAVRDAWKDVPSELGK